MPSLSSAYCYLEPFGSEGQNRVYLTDKLGFPDYPTSYICQALTIFQSPLEDRPIRNPYVLCGVLAAVLSGCASPIRVRAR